MTDDARGSQSGKDLPVDAVLSAITEYVLAVEPGAESPLAGADTFNTARLALLDALGCGMLALRFPECRKLLGPTVPGTIVPHGARVPGTPYVLDPITAAAQIGIMNRWLDYNDTWLAAEWGHPSDNAAGILAVADYLSRTRRAVGHSSTGMGPLTMRDVLAAMIQAYEIQGVFALENRFNGVGLDHVLLVKVATAAVVTRMLGGGRGEILSAVSNAWMDGGTLRAYRHAPNTGSRKSWAAGDAASRGVALALMAMRGEMGYPAVLTTPTWGWEAVFFAGQPLRLARPFGSYVMENILFKVAYPAEFHAQTAVEAAIQLHPHLVPQDGHRATQLPAERWREVTRIRIATQQSAIRIIAKDGPLHNPADRDHSLQYITAVSLLHGALDATMYEDAFAADPRIDALRDRMEVVEEPRYSRDYLDPEKRSIANAIQIWFADGSATDEVAVEYPLGHRRRRAEALPLLEQKLRTNLATCLTARRVDTFLQRTSDLATLMTMPVPDFVDMLVE